MKISKEEFLSLAGMEYETLDAWIEEEWLIPSGSPVDHELLRHRYSQSAAHP